MERRAVSASEVLCWSSRHCTCVVPPAKPAAAPGLHVTVFKTINTKSSLPIHTSAHTLHLIKFPADPSSGRHILFAMTMSHRVRPPEGSLELDLQMSC